MADLKQLNDYLLDKVNIKSILDFDTRFRDVFEDVFYSISSATECPQASEEDATTKNNLNNSSIISHFLKHWKSIQDYSAITKSLPTILTGEIYLVIWTSVINAHGGVSCIVVAPPYSPQEYKLRLHTSEPFQNVSISMKWLRII